MTLRATLIWAGLLAVVSIPLIVAARSPLLEWREPIYIAAGFAGILGLVLLLVQPLLILGALPGIPARRVHAWVGAGLVFVVVVHVVGLWITSPPDVVDVLLFRSPTPFAIWGAMAMWAVFAAALLAAVRKSIGLRVWRLAHTIATSVVVIGTVIHVWQIEGTMGDLSKTAICVLVLGTILWAIGKRRAWLVLRR